MYLWSDADNMKSVALVVIFLLMSFLQIIQTAGVTQLIKNITIL